MATWIISWDGCTPGDDGTLVGTCCAPLLLMKHVMRYAGKIAWEWLCDRPYGPNMQAWRWNDCVSGVIVIDVSNMEPYSNTARRISLLMRLIGSLRSVQYLIRRKRATSLLERIRSDGSVCNNSLHFHAQSGDGNIDSQLPSLLFNKDFPKNQYQEAGSGWMRWSGFWACWLQLDIAYRRASVYSNFSGEEGSDWKSSLLKPVGHAKLKSIDLTYPVETVVGIMEASRFSISSTRGCRAGKRIIWDKYTLPMASLVGRRIDRQTLVLDRPGGYHDMPAYHAYELQDEDN